VKLPCNTKITGFLNYRMYTQRSAKSCVAYVASGTLLHEAICSLRCICHTLIRRT